MKHGKRWALWSVLGIAVFVVAAVVYRLGQSPKAVTKTDLAATPVESGVISTASSSPNASSPRSSPATTPPSSTSISAAPAEPPKEAREKMKDPALEMWRSAIITKNAQQVYAAERAFLGDKAKYHDGLAAQAEKDANDRVRAFSTRMLGKFAMAGDVDLFARLLENDPNPYVRQNSAWALGELKQGAEALQRASTKDENKDVRAEAASALGRLH